MFLVYILLQKWVYILVGNRSFTMSGNLQWAAHYLQRTAQMAYSIAHKFHLLADFCTGTNFCELNRNFEENLILFEFLYFLRHEMLLSVNLRRKMQWIMIAILKNNFGALDSHQNQAKNGQTRKINPDENQIILYILIWWHIKLSRLINILTTNFK